MKKTGKDWIENITERLEEKRISIKLNQERLESLQADLITTKALVYDADRVQTSVSGEKLSEKCALMQEIDSKIDFQIEAYNLYREKSIREIDKLVQNPVLAKCLKMRHIDMMSNSQIAIKEEITERGVRKRFVKAYSLLNSIYTMEKYRKFTKKVDSSAKTVVV